MCGPYLFSYFYSVKRGAVTRQVEVEKFSDLGETVIPRMTVNILHT